jgi:glyoxylase-like metal-dependent hydrolase (beta-lactamase superfamily II)
VFYLSGSGRHILVDTGMEDFMAPEGVGDKYGFEAMDFETALESVGITPEDVDLVIQTHLHNDHCENTYKCKNARVIVQRAEYEFARNPHPLDH